MEIYTNLSFFMLDLYLLKLITKIASETGASRRRLLLRFRVDLKVEIPLLGDDGKKLKIEALSNTSLLQFLQTVLSLSKGTGGTTMRKSYLSSTRGQHIPYHSFPRPEKWG